MKRYEGRREWFATRVTVNKCRLNPRFDLRNHSPTGFEWGYGGSGPAQLALAILADHCHDDQRALDFYQRFKWAVIAQLPARHWSLTSEGIERALAGLREAETLREGAP